MKRFIIPSILFVAFLPACSPSLKVTSDYDRTADFSKFKTYSFSPESQNLPINDLNKRRILSEVETQLAAKGFTKGDPGDILVDIRVSAQERKEATAYTSGNGYGMYGGYRYGGGFQTTNYSVQTYVDGTLIISFIDVQKKELVWQGTGVKTLDPDATADKREKNITEAVKGIIAKYPPGQKK
jgi:hypothetical protein